MRKAIDETIGLEDLAEALGLTAEGLKRRHRALHRDRGLPLPLSYGVGGKNWRWPGAATRAWLSHGPQVSGRAGPAAASFANDNQAEDGAEYIAASRRAIRDFYGIDSR